MEQVALWYDNSKLILLISILVFYIYMYCGIDMDGRDS